MKHPFLKNLRFYLLTWLAIVVVHGGILYKHYNIPVVLALADSLVYNALYAGVAIDFWYAVRFLNIERRRPLVLILAHVIAAAIFVVLWLIAGNYLMNLLDGGNITYKTFVMEAFPARVISGFLYYFIIILVYYLFIYYSSFREKLTREADLRALVKETELSLLRSQLNPHFIFNSLNSISALTLSSPAMAQDMLIRLSSYLRYALEHHKDTLIAFEQELENSLLYLEIEKVRFGEKLIFEKEIEESCGQALVPAMLLQPLLENAIKHGVYESQAPVIIHMNCSLRDHVLHICISNNFETEVVSKRRKGIGLRNVQERLHLLYGRKDLMNTAIRDAVYEVDLYIPQN